MTLSISEFFNSYCNLFVSWVSYFLKWFGLPIGYFGYPPCTERDLFDEIIDL